MKWFKKKKGTEILPRKKPLQKTRFQKAFGFSIGFWALYSKMDKKQGAGISKEMVKKIYERVLVLEKKEIFFDPDTEIYDTTLKIHMKDGTLIIYGFWNMNEEETIDEIVGARFYKQAKDEKPKESLKK
ncbi:hypothetical protein IGI37_001384 [Enterococcus sp. AZ194]|uniref:hypothetical protein n=1 Tax=Enterococcus sp. AZ194 TaxID=2774629 RepID=UPI003F2246B4